MAETADMLTEANQQVILPDLTAGLHDGRYGGSLSTTGRLGAATGGKYPAGNFTDYPY